MKSSKKILILFLLSFKLHAVELNQDCAVSILNRTVQVSENGTWDMPNVPSFMGRIRARVTCERNGETISGATGFFTVQNNLQTVVDDFLFAQELDVDLTQVKLKFLVERGLLISSDEPERVRIFKEVVGDITLLPLSEFEKSGLNLISSNENILRIENDLYVPVASGVVTVTARIDGSIALQRVIVDLGDTEDLDGDGLTDAFELENGLDPNDPIDAFEDADLDGLSNFDEFQEGTGINEPDSDSDGIEDGEELIEGDDGFITEPLLPDSDGDGLRDGLETLVGSNPTDRDDANLADALDSISISPSQLELVFNSIDTEVSSQITVTGVLIDGVEIDLTDHEQTNYLSSDLSVASFGSRVGEVFGGQPGLAVLTVANNGFVANIDVNVTGFDPIALSAIDIPGYANNIDVSGNLAFIAAGSAGLVIVDVSDKEAPFVISEFDTNGTTIDIKVINNLVYLADGDAGVKLIDVTDPLNPILLSEQVTRGTAQDIAISSDYVYVADGEGGLAVLNFTDFLAPTFVTSLDFQTDARGISFDDGRLAVVTDSAMHMVDVTEPGTPLLRSFITSSLSKDVVLDGDYAYVAAFSNGYRVFNVADINQPFVVGGDNGIAPRDLALNNGLLLFAEQLFPNVVAIVNVQDPESAVFQSTIDLSPLGDFAGTGIALDGDFTYVTEEAFFVGQDYAAIGNTRLFIAQYRQTVDNQGVAPSIELIKPLSDSVLLEGSRLQIEAEASDDVSVLRVEFIVNGEIIGVDNSSPYQSDFQLPSGEVSDLTFIARAIDFGGNVSETTPLLLSTQIDSDNDGLTDLQELNIYFTLPEVPDTDTDGIDDGREVILGTRPDRIDTDGDGINDGTEISAETDPLNPDAVSPEILQVTPAFNSIDIPESSSLQVIFNEQLSVRNNISSTAFDLRESLTGLTVPGRARMLGGGSILEFQPDELLKSFTSYDIRLNSDEIRDLAGNRLNERSIVSTFTTGVEFDIQAPFVEHSSPVVNSLDVPVNSSIVLQLNERVKRSSFDPDNFSLKDQTTGQSVNTIVTINDNLNRIEITPITVLPVGRGFELIASGLVDFADNRMISISISDFITTAFNSDNQPPTVENISFNDAIPTNVNLTIDFSESINSIDISGIAIFNGDNQIGIQSIEATRNNLRLILILNDQLQPSTTYTVSVRGIRDLSGNLQLQRVDQTFTTRPEVVSGVDIIRPTVINLFPTNETFDTPINTIALATFSEPIDPTSLTSSSFSIRDANQSFSVVPGFISVSDDRLSATYTPSQPLVSGNRYQFRLTSSIRDFAGNSLSGTNNTLFTPIENEDVEQLEISFISLVDGAEDIPINTQIRVLFDDILDPNSLSQSSFVLTLNGIIVDVVYELGSDLQTVIIRPVQLLSTDSDYELLVTGVTDKAGNVLDPFSSTFTTTDEALNDETGPTIVSSVPENNQSSVSINSPISLTFSEVLDATTVNDASVNITVIGSSGNVPGSYGIDGKVVTFTPLANFPGNAQIQVSVSNEITDLVGNRSIPFQSVFTVENIIDTEQPSVVSIVPANGSVNIPIITDVTALFSEFVDTSDLQAVLNINGVKREITRNRATRRTSSSITFNVNAPVDSVVSIELSGIRDLSGNEIQDFVSTYLTVANINQAQVITQRPSDDAIVEDLTKKITLVVNVPLVESSIEGALNVSQNGVLVDGAIDISSDGYVIEFTPDEPWTDGSLVEVFLNSTAISINDMPVSNHQGSFRVMQTDNLLSSTRIRPRIIDGSITSFIQPINPVLTLLINKPLDASTIVNDNLRLVRTDTGGIVPITIGVSDQGQLLTIVPNELLTPNTIYNIVSESDVVDLDGLSFSSSSLPTRIDSFQTNDIEDQGSPIALGSSPALTAERIPTNAIFQVQFNEPVDPLSMIASGIELINPNGNILACDVSFTNDGENIFITPDTLLSPNTSYQLDLSSIVDFAGNQVIDQSLVYTTGSGPNVNVTNVNRISVADGATNVPVNSVISFELSEHVNPLSQNGALLREDDSGRAVSGDVRIDVDSRRLAFVPSEQLAAGRSFTFTPNQHLDILGNGIIGDSVSFTTSFLADLTPPELLSVVPQNGAEGVALNSQIVVQFDEPIARIKDENISLSINAQNVPVRQILSNNSTQLVLIPLQPFGPLQTYRLKIEDISDISGNNVSDMFVSQFTTSRVNDVTNPNIISLTPITNEVNVVRNIVPELIFDEPINPQTINSSNFYIQIGLNSIAGKVDVSMDGLSARFILDEPLEPFTTYQVLHSPSEYRDLAGNIVNTLTTGTASRSFTTGQYLDTEFPIVISSSPSEGSTNVAINSEISARFNEQVLTSSVNNDSFKVLLDGEIVPGRVSLESDLQTLRFIPLAPLLTNSTYEVLIENIIDNANNISEVFETDFVTSTSTDFDTDAPVLLTTLPEDSDVNVDVTAPIILTFSENISPISVTQESLVISVSGFSGQISGRHDVQGEQIIFTPSSPLPGNSLVRVSITDLIEDYSGNNTSASVFTFTTGSANDLIAPEVIAITPSNGADNVSASTSIVITFNEPIDPSTIIRDNFLVFVEGERISQVDVRYSSNNRTVTIASNGLTGIGRSPFGGQQVSVVLSGNLQDFSGNSVRDFQSTFITSVFTPARFRVISQRPANGATDVSADENILLYLNDTVDEGALGDGFNVTQNGVIVEGVTRVVSSGHAIEFTPNEAFQIGANVRVFLSDQIASIMGATLFNYEGQFNIIDTPSAEINAVLIESVPSSNELVPLNTILEFKFSKPLDPNSINDSSIIIGRRDVFRDSIPLTVNLLSDQQTLQVVPIDGLLPDQSYSVGFFSSISDIDGLSISSPRRGIVFMTTALEDIEAPSVDLVSPSDGAIGVGINSNIKIRFSEPVNPISVSDSSFMLVSETGPSIACSFNFSSDGRDIEMLPHRPLNSKSEYQLLVSGIVDRAGNEMDSFMSKFITSVGPALADVIVVDSNPRKDMVGVPTNFVAGIRFNQPIDPFSITDDSFFLGAAISPFNSLVSGSGLLSNGGRDISFVPNSPLLENQTYAIAYGLRDTAGNPVSRFTPSGIADVGDFTTSSISDIEVPILLSVNTDVASNGIPVNSHISANFNEPLSPLSLNELSLQQGGVDVPVKIELSDDGMSVSLIPASLLTAFQPYSFMIEGVTDLAGNVIDGVSQHNFIVNNSVDIDRPSFNSSSPANGQQDVPLNTSVSVNFNEPLDTTSIRKSSLYLENVITQEVVVAEINVSPDLLSAVITPASSLLPGTSYKVVITQTISDLAGNDLLLPFRFTLPVFTTVN